MINKNHNHKLQTNSWHREEGPHNNHEAIDSHYHRGDRKIPVA